MKTHTYSKYIESKSKWISDIPTHWQAVPTKRSYYIQLGKMLQPTPTSPHDQEVSYLKAQHVLWETVRVEDLPTMWASPGDEKKYGVQNGDLLACEGGEAGRAAMLGEVPPNTIIQNALHRVRPKEKNRARFLMYVLAHASSQKWFEMICNKATIAHFTAEKFGALRIPLPPVEEQTTITAFLDRKSAEIDALVAKKRTLIEKLREKRSALISRTVTRGLPPEDARAAGLEPNPKMKDSDIPWIREIPRHWGIKRLRHISDDITVGVVVNPSSYVSDEGVPFLLGGDIREFNISLENCNRCLAEVSDGSLLKSRLTPGDLVVVRVGYPGVAAVIPPELDGANCASMMIVRKHARFVSQWLTYMFNSQVGRDQIEIVQYGAAQKQFNISHAVDFSFPFPPRPEQLAIADFLDRETAKIDLLIAKVQQAIERLQEYRTALITAAVTGKIDVRQAERVAGVHA